MQRQPERSETKFKGTLKHYHRSGSQTNRTWDDWVFGTGQKKARRNWFRIILISLALLALGGIIAAMIIVLQ
ncbi:MAG: hypothetical protein H8M99_13860 [Gloeobacteraceae cyanobacterium ES-bin-144]|nr:hypothetical protein [Verrucomicrobiales bacterium]